MQWNQRTMPLIGNVAVQPTYIRCARRKPSFRMQIRSNHCEIARAFRFDADWERSLALRVIHVLKIMIPRLPLRTLWKCRPFGVYGGNRGKCQHHWTIIISILLKQQKKQLQACCGYIYGFVFLAKCCLAGMKMVQQLSRVLLQMVYRVKIALIMIGSLPSSSQIFKDKVCKRENCMMDYVTHHLPLMFFAI